MEMLLGSKIATEVCQRTGQYITCKLLKTQIRTFQKCLMNNQKIEHFRNALIHVQCPSLYNNLGLIFAEIENNKPVCLYDKFSILKHWTWINPKHTQNKWYNYRSEGN